MRLAAETKLIFDPFVIVGAVFISERHHEGRARSRQPWSPPTGEPLKVLSITTTLAG